MYFRACCSCQILNDAHLQEDQFTELREGYLRILDKLVLQIFLCVEINLRSTQAVNRILVRLGANYWDQTTTPTVLRNSRMIFFFGWSVDGGLRQMAIVNGITNTLSFKLRCSKNFPRNCKLIFLILTFDPLSQTNSHYNSAQISY